MSREILVATAGGLVLDGEVVALSGRDVTGLVRAGDGGWFAVTDRSEVHAIARDWSAESLATAPGIDAIGMLGGQPAVGTEGAHLLVVNPSDAAPDPAFDEAPRRADWYTPWGGPPTVRSLDEGPDGLGWVNVHVGGVLVGDGGRWQPTMDVDNDVHQVVAHPDRHGTAFCAAAVGLGWTTDGGEVWRWSTSGLHARYARGVAVAGDLVFLSVSRGPGGREAALYRGIPGETLERCDGIGRHDENIDTGWVAARDGLAAVVTPDGTAFASTDAGRSWEGAFAVTAPRQLALIPG